MGNHFNSSNQIRQFQSVGIARDSPAHSREQAAYKHLLMTYFDFNEGWWRRIRTSNCIERLNKEIKKKTKVVVFFPNLESCGRLIGSLLMEQHEEWMVVKAYLTEKDLPNCRRWQYVQILHILSIIPYFRSTLFLNVLFYRLDRIKESLFHRRERLLLVFAVLASSLFNRLLMRNGAIPLQQLFSASRQYLIQVF